MTNETNIPEKPEGFDEYLKYLDDCRMVDFYYEKYEMQKRWEQTIARARADQAVLAVLREYDLLLDSEAREALNAPSSAGPAATADGQ
jgi:hypothetical protein